MGARELQVNEDGEPICGEGECTAVRIADVADSERECDSCDAIISENDPMFPCPQCTDSDCCKACYSKAGGKLPEATAFTPERLLAYNKVLQQRVKAQEAKLKDQPDTNDLLARLEKTTKLLADAKKGKPKSRSRSNKGPTGCVSTDEAIAGIQDGLMQSGKKAVSKSSTALGSSTTTAVFNPWSANRTNQNIRNVSTEYDHYGNDAGDHKKYGDDDDGSDDDEDDEDEESDDPDDSGGHREQKVSKDAVAAVQELRGIHGLFPNVEKTVDTKNVFPCVVSVAKGLIDPVQAVASFENPHAVGVLAQQAGNLKQALGKAGSKDLETIKTVAQNTGSLGDILDVTGSNAKKKKRKKLLETLHLVLTSLLIQKPKPGTMLRERCQELVAQLNRDNVPRSHIDRALGGGIVGLREWYQDDVHSDTLGASVRPLSFLESLRSTSSDHWEKAITRFLPSDTELDPAREDEENGEARELEWKADRKIVALALLPFLIRVIRALAAKMGYFQLHPFVIGLILVNANPEKFMLHLVEDGSASLVQYGSAVWDTLKGAAKGIPVGGERHQLSGDGLRLCLDESITVDYMAWGVDNPPPPQEADRKEAQRKSELEKKAEGDRRAIVDLRAAVDKLAKQGGNGNGWTNPREQKRHRDFSDSGADLSRPFHYVDSNKNPHKEKILPKDHEKFLTMLKKGIITTREFCHKCANRGAKLYSCLHEEKTCQR